MTVLKNKENTFTEKNRFLVYSDQLDATVRTTLDTVGEMIARSAIQTFEDEGETVTATDASYLAGLTIDGKAVQDGTPTPDSPVDIETVSPVDGDSIGIVIGDDEYPIDMNGYVLATLPDGMKDVLTVDAVGYVTIDEHSKKITLDGTESWTAYAKWDGSGQYCYYTKLNDAHKEDIPLCSHLKGIDRTEFSGETKPPNTCTIDTSRNICVRVPQSTAAAFKTWLGSNNLTVVYPLETANNVDLGYINMPEIPEGAEISVSAQVVPTIAVKWWTKNQSEVAAAFGAVSSNLAALDARVTALESGNAKSLVLEKSEIAKEPASEPAEIDEQEEMDFEE